MGAFYLQISKALIAAFLATSPNHWDIQPIATKYKNSNGDTVYVAERRWIDSVLQGVVLNEALMQPIDLESPDVSVKIVYLNDSEVIK